MKKTEFQKTKALSSTELNKKLAELQSQLTTAYLEKNARKLENTALIKKVKAEIAQIQTLLNNETKQS